VLPQAERRVAMAAGLGWTHRLALSRPTTCSESPPAERVASGGSPEGGEEISLGWSEADPPVRPQNMTAPRQGYRTTLQRPCRGSSVLGAMPPRAVLRLPGPDLLAPLQGAAALPFACLAILTAEVAQHTTERQSHFESHRQRRWFASMEITVALQGGDHAGEGAAILGGILIPARRSGCVSPRLRSLIRSARSETGGRADSARRPG